MPRWLPPLVLAVACSGCVTLYEPLVGLSRPSVLNPELNNFDGLHLMVRCIPSDYTDSGDSEVLCSNLKNLFANQGAEVEVQVPDSDLPPEDGDDLVVRRGGSWVGHRATVPRHPLVTAVREW